jgi:hypothetical protein
LTKEEWDGFRSNLKLIMQFPTYLEYWQTFQVMFSASFRGELNDLLATEPPFDLRKAFVGQEQSAGTGNTLRETTSSAA